MNGGSLESNVRSWSSSRRSTSSRSWRRRRAWTPARDRVARKAGRSLAPRGLPHLTSWQRVQLARIQAPLHARLHRAPLRRFQRADGDRQSGTTKRCRWHGASRWTASHARRPTEGPRHQRKYPAHFGMPHPKVPQGAAASCRPPAKFGRPIVTFVDRPGRFPAVDAEKRGQSEAIARTCARWSSLRCRWSSS